MSSDGNTYTDIDAAPIIVGTQTAGPPAPVISSLVETGGNVVAAVPVPATTGSAELAAIRLYRGATQNGPWAQTDERPISEISQILNLYDEDPVFGIATYYAATVLDVNSTESPKSAALSISAS